MTEHESGPGNLSFRPFQADVERRLLFRGGDVLAIGSRAMDILLTFLGRPGSLITTRELLESAWPRSKRGRCQPAGADLCPAPDPGRGRPAVRSKARP